MRDLGTELWDTYPNSGVPIISGSSVRSRPPALTEGDPFGGSSLPLRRAHLMTIDPCRRGFAEQSSTNSNRAHSEPRATTSVLALLTTYTLSSPWSTALATASSRDEASRLVMTAATFRSSWWT